MGKEKDEDLGELSLKVELVEGGGAVAVHRGAGGEQGNTSQSLISTSFPKRIIPSRLSPLAFSIPPQIVWHDKSVIAETFTTLKFHQRINHFLGMQVISSKAQLFSRLMKLLRRHLRPYDSGDLKKSLELSNEHSSGVRDEDFSPETWHALRDAMEGFFPESFSTRADKSLLSCLEEELSKKEHAPLHHVPSLPLPDSSLHHQSSSPLFFIIKPNARCEGKGIRLSTSPFTALTPEERQGKGESLVQLYVDRPLLIEGKKFDLRIYVLITSLNAPFGFRKTPHGGGEEAGRAKEEEGKKLGEESRSSSFNSTTFSPFSAGKKKEEAPKEDLLKGIQLWVHSEGMVRMCALDYAVPSPANCTQNGMHLTNYAVNKRLGSYTVVPHTTTLRNSSSSSSSSSPLPSSFSSAFGSNSSGTPQGKLHRTKAEGEEKQKKNNIGAEKVEGRHIRDFPTATATGEMVERDPPHHPSSSNIPGSETNVYMGNKRDFHWLEHYINNLPETSLNPEAMKKLSCAYGESSASSTSSSRWKCVRRAIDECITLTVLSGIEPLRKSYACNHNINRFRLLSEGMVLAGDTRESLLQKRDENAQEGKEAQVEGEEEEKKRNKSQKVPLPPVLPFHREKEPLFASVCSSSSPPSSVSSFWTCASSSCFELLGFDIMLCAETLQPVLMEVNHSPSLFCETIFDAHLKKTVLADLFKLLGHTTPSRSYCNTKPRFCKAMHGLYEKYKASALEKEKEREREEDRGTQEEEEEVTPEGTGLAEGTGWRRLLPGVEMEEWMSSPSLDESTSCSSWDAHSSFSGKRPSGCIWTREQLEKHALMVHLSQKLS